MTETKTETKTAKGNPSEDATVRNRRMLLAMFAIAFLTLGGSYMLFYAAREGGVWGTTNQGEFVDPPLAVGSLGPERRGRRADHGSRHLVAVGGHRS